MSTLSRAAGSRRLNLNLAIWVAFANARIKAERRESEQTLAA
jgi:hypothetical protein